MNKHSFIFINKMPSYISNLTFYKHKVSFFFSGHLVEKIPQEIIANSGSAFIYFYSDLSEVQLGFNILYRY